MSREETAHSNLIGLCSSNRISTLEDGSFRYYNLMPGDRKLSNKGHSTFYKSDEGYTCWKDPVRQIVHCYG